VDNYAHSHAENHLWINQPVDNYELDSVSPWV